MYAKTFSSQSSSSLLQKLDVPLLRLGPLVTCYLLPWHSIAWLQQSVVIEELLFHIRQDMNLLLVLVVPFCHTRSTYNGAEKVVSSLAVYVPYWIGFLRYSLSSKFCKLWHYASMHSPRLGQCMQKHFLPNPLICHGTFWGLKRGALSVFFPHTPHQNHLL